MKKRNGFLSKLGIGEKPALQRHDVILTEIDRATYESRVTIEEHIKLRGFPYSRTFHKRVPARG